MERKMVEVFKNSQTRDEPKFWMLPMAVFTHVVLDLLNVSYGQRYLDVWRQREIQNIYSLQMTK